MEGKERKKKENKEKKKKKRRERRGLGREKKGREGEEFPAIANDEAPPNSTIYLHNISLINEKGMYSKITVQTSKFERDMDLLLAKAYFYDPFEKPSFSKHLSGKTAYSKKLQGS